ncbi:MAG: hypothetical protein IKQ01_03400 [Bacteroidales bacterium]|nr:hypothetical protein [Bacteroidales bacterium]
MNTSNIAIAAIFAFKEVSDKHVLSVLVFDGENDSFELPTVEITASDNDSRDQMIRHLLVDEERGRIKVRSDELLRVPTNEGYAVVYSAILPEWPGRPRGTNWISILPDRTISEELAFDHNIIIKESLDAIVNALVAPIPQLPSFGQEIQSQLWNALMSEEQKAEWLEKVKCFGVDPSAVSVLSDFTSHELKIELGERLKNELNAKEEGKTVPEEKQGKYVYDFIHPNLTVDVVVLAVNEKGELVIPLTVQSGAEKGNGLWKLPGGFVTYDDYILAGWEPGKSDSFDSNIQEYLEDVKKGHSVVVEAANRFVKEKAGIELPPNTKFYHLTAEIQDNPRHGEADGAPIISRSLLAIVRDYTLFENNTITNPIVQGLRWFPISRRLFRNGSLIIEERGKAKEEAVMIDGKTSALLTYDSTKADAYITNGYLIVDHCQGDYANRKTRGVDEETILELYGHHSKVIVEALEVIKDKAFRTTLLADFINKKPEASAWNCRENAISFDYYKKVRDAVKCFDPSVRQNLFDKETAKELKEEELREKLSVMKDVELMATAKKKGLDVSSLKSLTTNERIQCIMDKMKEETYKWKDPSGGIHYFINNGFLVKDPVVSRTYFLCEELYRRFLDLGSTI